MKTLLILALLVLGSSMAYAAECTGFDQFYGTIQIDDQDAPIGTQIRGVVEGNPSDAYTTTQVGQYGVPLGQGQDKLPVLCDNDNQQVNFEVFIGSWVDTGESAQCVCGLHLDPFPLTAESGPEDADDDGYTVAQGDCDDGNPDINPGETDVCNGVNDDCDGETDEDFASSPTDCGVGACYSTGETQCQGGTEIDTCQEGTPGDDSNCDGVDDDCDGTDDDDYTGQATTCGIGACYAEGAMECISGSEVDSCSEGSPAADDATCDGIDDDCDEAVDEDFAPYGSDCGVGECYSEGEVTCVEGSEVDSCEEGAPSDEVCDGLDNDCDGTDDEGVTSTFYEDSDSDTFGDAQSTEEACVAPSGYVSDDNDCDDSDADINPDATEVCNGADDDCDGETDEGDVCQGTPDDQDGDGYDNTEDCDDDNAAVNPGATEVCNGIDDNCNLETDEGSDICSQNDISVNECNYDPDGNSMTLDQFSFDSVCEGDSGCTQADVNWEDSISHDCDASCDAACFDNEDCDITECPTDGCFEGTYRDYSDGLSNDCVDCACEENQCSYSEPYTEEVCDDLIDNDCDGETDENCDCVIDDDCGEDFVCRDNECVDSYCELYMPIDLIAGWNLIGFPSCDAMPVEDGLSSIDGKYTDVFVKENGVWYNYNANAPSEVNTLTMLDPLQGMYIYMTEPGTLIV